MFLNEVDIRKSVSKLFSESENIDCAVAFVGEKALEIIPKNRKVRMICNLESGATNPHTIKALLKRKNVDIKTSAKLHAKVYIGDNYTIIGSANLSANGLGLEGDEITGWIEAGYKEKTNSGQDNIRKWWLKHWNNSKMITEKDIDKYIGLWSVRRNSRTRLQGEQSLFSVLSSNPERIKDRRIYFVLYAKCLSDEAQNALDNVQKNKSEYGINVGAYEGWEELPENAYLIDVYVGPRGGVTYQGIYKSPEKKIIIKFPDGNEESETLFLCYKTEKISGYSVTQLDIDQMKPAIKNILESEDIGTGDCHAKYIGIMDARSFIVKS